MTTHDSDNESSQPPPGPLNSIRILDIATVYAAPITAMLLGDYGADILKIEHPRGDPARTHGHSKDGHGLWWKVLARNKRAVTLNLSHPAGREIYYERAERTRIFRGVFAGSWVCPPPGSSAPPVLSSWAVPHCNSMPMMICVHVVDSCRWRLRGCPSVW